MTLSQLIWAPVIALDNRRPRFFSKYEWRYHVLMMPFLFPLGNYYFIGSGYFSDPLLFWIGTVIVLGLYWLSVILLTLVIRWTIRRYPTVSQTLPRTLVMLILVCGLTIVLAVFDVWVYSLIPTTTVRFSWTAVRPIWILGLVFDIFLCMALSLFYTYAQWSQDLTESEQLQQIALQRQYDNLKGQLNPHFLFNALNSLSVLIGENPQVAEQFVDKLARVYRYMLQTSRQVNGRVIGNESELVTLQAELDFIALYTELLQVRYGRSLRVEKPSVIDPAYLSCSLLPLSLLTLIENAVKYNSMSSRSPLVIQIDVTDNGLLRVLNNRQHKSLRLETSQGGLTSLMEKYRRIASQSILVEATDNYFSVSIPLLTVGEL